MVLPDKCRTKVKGVKMLRKFNIHRENPKQAFGGIVILKLNQTWICSAYVFFSFNSIICNSEIRLGVFLGEKYERSKLAIVTTADLQCSRMLARCHKHGNAV